MVPGTDSVVTADDPYGVIPKGDSKVSSIRSILTTESPRIFLANEFFEHCVNSNISVASLKKNYLIFPYLYPKLTNYDKNNLADDKEYSSLKRKYSEYLSSISPVIFTANDMFFKLISKAFLKKDKNVQVFYNREYFSSSNERFTNIKEDIFQDKDTYSKYPIDRYIIVSLDEEHPFLITFPHITWDTSIGNLPFVRKFYNVVSDKEADPPKEFLDSMSGIAKECVVFAKSDDQIFKIKTIIEDVRQEIIDGFLINNKEFLQLQQTIYSDLIDPEDGSILLHPVHLTGSYINGQGRTCSTPFSTKAMKFKDIKHNYSSDIQEQLGQVTTVLSEDTYLGKIIILEGDPGTGKSYFINSLCLEIGSEFDPVVVLNPKIFFSSPDYYLTMLGHQGDFGKNLFIFEDSTVLLDVNNHGSSGLLLNFTDGMIGSGREDVFLFTFNQNIKELDPAILRAGRCLSHIKFPHMSHLEDRVKFFENQGFAPEIADRYAKDSNEDATLSDLFERVKSVNQRKIYNKQYGKRAGF